jgi:hypothetical protein
MARKIRLELRTFSDGNAKDTQAGLLEGARGISAGTFRLFIDVYYPVIRSDSSLIKSTRTDDNCVVGCAQRLPNFNCRTSMQYRRTVDEQLKRARDNFSVSASFIRDPLWSRITLYSRIFYFYITCRESRWQVAGKRRGGNCSRNIIFPLVSFIWKC